MTKRWYRHHYVLFYRWENWGSGCTWSRTQSKTVAQMGLESLSIISTVPLVQSSDNVEWKEGSGGREIWIRIQASTTDLLYDLEQAAYQQLSSFIILPLPIEFIPELKKIMYKDGNTGFQMPSQTNFKTNGKLLELKVFWAIAFRYSWIQGL